MEIASSFLGGKGNQGRNSQGGRVSKVRPGKRQGQTAETCETPYGFLMAPRGPGVELPVGQ